MIEIWLVVNPEGLVLPWGSGSTRTLAIETFIEETITGTIWKDALDAGYTCKKFTAHTMVG